MTKFLLRIWRSMPTWLHFLAAKIVRSRFRVAVAALIFDEQERILMKYFDMNDLPKMLFAEKELIRWTAAPNF